MGVACMSGRHGAQPLVAFFSPAFRRAGRRRRRGGCLVSYMFLSAVRRGARRHRRREYFSSTDNGVLWRLSAGGGARRLVGGVNRLLNASLLWRNQRDAARRGWTQRRAARCCVRGICTFVPAACPRVLLLPLYCSAQTAAAAVWTRPLCCTGLFFCGLLPWHLLRALFCFFHSVCATLSISP